MVPTSASAADLIANRTKPSAPRDDNDGSAKMTTYLRYTGASTIRLRDTNVIDYCRYTASGPRGDGEGVYVLLRIQFRDGTRTDRAVVADTNGCGNGVTHTLKTWWLRPAPLPEVRRQIADVRSLAGATSVTAWTSSLVLVR